MSLKQTVYVEPYCEHMPLFVKTKQNIIWDSRVLILITMVAMPYGLWILSCARSNAFDTWVTGSSGTISNNTLRKLEYCVNWSYVFS